MKLRTPEAQADLEAHLARAAHGKSHGVRCTVTGKAPGVNGDYGAAWCSCVGCTVWRSREASAVPIYELPPMDGNIIPSDFSVTLQARGTR